ncbi:MAG TPA: tRNA guanosine(34) transglycosylase Tgt, partial [Opitutales bacterium]|nr:tRNA guanosine(34) transglycosylase Tgt [Opitutales bacterium]
MAPHFQVNKTETTTSARTGVLRTRHGEIQTPIFMPVGTQGTVKGVTPAQLDDLGAQIILGNTYHLHLRPGEDLIGELGGLHTFMGWEKPILTDSGGFQVFSLAKLREISENGISFQSHLDGKNVFLGPREAMEIQWKLGSDIAMVLDECPPYPCEKEACRGAVERSIRWARQCLELSQESGFLDRGHHLFAIVQGSSYEDLRRECAEALREMPFPG